MARSQLETGVWCIQASAWAGAMGWLRLVTSFGERAGESREAEVAAYLGSLYYLKATPDEQQMEFGSVVIARALSDALVQLSEQSAARAA